MAARSRGAREAVTADVGNVGRRTGRAMPREGEVRLTQDGFEDPDAYFDSPPPVPAVPLSKGQSSRKKKQQQHQEPPSSATKRQRPSHRPDVTAEIGVKGRRTGAAIAPLSARRTGNNGMDDMEQYFSQEPASVPPIKKTHKRVSDVQEEQDEDDDEDEDEDDEEVEDQTANYGGRGNQSSKTSNRSRATTAQDSSDDDVGIGGQSDEEDEEEDVGTPETQQARRVSMATSRADTTYGNLDDGTQTMDLEGSSYYNKSNNSFANRSVATSASNKKKYQQQRVDDYTTDFDNAPSPSNTSRPPIKNNSTKASTSRVQNIAAQSDASDEEDEEDEDEPLRASTSSRKRSLVSNNNDDDEEEEEEVDENQAPLQQQRSLDKGKGRERQVSPDSESENEDAAPAADDGGFDAGYEYDNNDNGPEQDGGSEDEADDGERLEPVQEEEEDEDDEEEEEEIEMPPPLNSASNSKKRKRDKEAKNDSGHIEEDGDDDDETIVQAGAKGKGKANGKGKAATKADGPAAKRKKRFEEEPEGVRRSGRDRTSPVEYWRNEHVVYRRRDSDGAMGAVYYDKVAVHTRPKAPVRHLGINGRNGRSKSATASQRAGTGAGARGKGRGKTRSVSVAAGAGGGGDDADEGDQSDNDRNWAEWDRDTDPDGITWDYVEGKEGKKRIAWTKRMISPKPTKNHAYKFQRVFTDGDFMAGGVLMIPPREAKPLKPARDNTYMLYCAQGAIRVLVHRTEFSIGPGGMFLIPRGNSYQIDNLTDIDAVLVFFQAREITAVVEGEDGEAER